MSSKKIIFVLDPMCSWCWGFAPVVKAFRNSATERDRVSLVMGGLRTSGDMVWDQKAKNYLRQQWDQVAHRTGQPFSDSLFDRKTFVYDTYPACKAVVSVRELFGIDSAFAYFHTIQAAFYLQGQDTSNFTVLQELLDSLQLNRHKFEGFFHSERAEVLMRHDFAKSRSMGANAFPSVVTIDEAGHMVCQKGYRNIENLKKTAGI